VARGNNSYILELFLKNIKTQLISDRFKYSYIKKKLFRRYEGRTDKFVIDKYLRRYRVFPYDPTRVDEMFDQENAAVDSRILKLSLNKYLKFWCKIPHYYSRLKAIKKQNKKIKAYNAVLLQSKSVLKFKKIKIV